jgi:hypothetical protein
MFGLTQPKLPIAPEQRQWVDDSFRRLAAVLGAGRLLNATVILPTPDHFPDPYDRSEVALQKIFGRVASAMRVDPTGIDVTLFVSGDDVTRSLIPFSFGPSSGPAGLYHHDPTTRQQISIDEKQMIDPIALVAVLAHEIGHIILLRPGLIPRDDPDMEPLTDLLTVFLGLGIFTANSTFRFAQYTNYRAVGWSASRLGYLSEEMFGYALARFAFERGETKPAWRSFLSTNIASYLRSSVAWLVSSDAAHLFNAE